MQRQNQKSSYSTDLQWGDRTGGGHKGAQMGAFGHGEMLKSENGPGGKARLGESFSISQRKEDQKAGKGSVSRRPSQSGPVAGDADQAAPQTPHHCALSPG